MRSSVVKFARVESCCCCEALSAGGGLLLQGPDRSSQLVVGNVPMFVVPLEPPVVAAPAVVLAAPLPPTLPAPAFGVQNAPPAD